MDAYNPFPEALRAQAIAHNALAMAATINERLRTAVRERRRARVLARLKAKPRPLSRKSWGR